MPTTSNPRNLDRFTMQERIDFLHSFKMVIVEFHGTCWKNEEYVEGAAAAINALINAGKQVKLVTGNSLYDDEYYKIALSIMGIHSIPAADIIHPAKTLVRHVQKMNLIYPVFSIASEVVNGLLKSSQIRFKTWKDVKLTTKNLKEEIIPSTEETRNNPDKEPGDGNIACVVMDHNFNMTYGQMSKAITYLCEPKVPLLTTCSSSFFQIDNEFKVLGNSGYVETLRTLTGKDPIICCKPSQLAKEDIMEQFKIKKPNEVLFVGTSLIDDMQFGIECGFRTLVISNELGTLAQCLHPDVEKSVQHMKPDFSISNLAELADFVHQVKGQELFN